MEIIIAALITGVVGLIAAIIALTPKLNKILNSLNAQNTAAEHRHDKRSNEHRGLSGEHSGLSKEHDRLSIEHKELCSGITAATQDLRALREGQIRDEERQHLLVGKQLDMSNILRPLITRCCVCNPKISVLFKHKCSWNKKCRFAAAAHPSYSAASTHAGT